MVLVPYSSFPIMDAVSGADDTIEPASDILPLVIGGVLDLSLFSSVLLGYPKRYFMTVPPGSFS